ncbi:MAG: DUF3570 domain-containing protein [Bacteroidetes bacterium]|nr:DUF3570 domain-containing protein [Bacteroidota bacterium]
MKSALIIMFLLIFGIQSYAQAEYQMKSNSDETEANFLFSYYDQDGDNAAVTGGIGTEKLTDIAALFVVNIPLDSANAINLNVGADNYSSASTDMIDNNISSASSHDLRIYGNLGFNRKNFKRSETYGIRFGFSNEYDYTSLSGGLQWAKEWNEGNSELGLSGQVFIDQWQLVFPRELRGSVNVSTDKRQSYNFQAVYSQVINKRLQFSLSGEAIYMKGLLSTPFHRVYFSDNNQHDIERLPDTRLKIPIGLRINYYPFDKLILRSYYRYYWDDFGIQAHTFSLEAPVKVSPTFTVYPFYRYHTQSASDYFAPFEAHTSTDPFYTSDYDLSALDSHKVGLGVKYAPLYGIGRANIPVINKLFMVKYAQIRTAYYTRSTGLNAFMLSLDLGFSIGKRKKN